VLGVVERFDGVDVIVRDDEEVTGRERISD